MIFRFRYSLLDLDSVVVIVVAFVFRIPCSSQRSSRTITRFVRGSLVTRERHRVWSVGRQKHDAKRVRQSFAPSNGIHVVLPMFSLRFSRRVAQYLYARDICIHHSLTPPPRPADQRGGDFFSSPW